MKILVTGSSGLPGNEVVRLLKERGIPENLIEEAFAAAAEEMDPEQAQMDQIRRWLHKRGYDPGTADYALKQKTMMSLHRKGFETELIRRAMDE